MRISDWSSDVCSSDLAAQHLQARRVGEPQMVEIGADAKFGGEVEIGARADEDRAGIVEVRLPLFLRRAQRIQYAVAAVDRNDAAAPGRSAEHTSELQSLMRISYAVFCLQKQNITYPICHASHYTKRPMTKLVPS